MRVVIIGLVFVAIILAGGTAYLLRDYISAQQAEILAQKPKAPTVKVLIAASDMPMGTAVNENNTEWIDWPKENVPEGFLVRTKDSNPLTEITKDTHLARHGFIKGEPITKAYLYKSGTPGFLPGVLHPGMRAVSVKSSAVAGANGFILPEDRVDLILTHSMAKAALKTKGEADSMLALQNTAETILENLRVLAIDQKTNEFEGGAAVAKNILLEVTAKQAEIINAANKMGTLSLSLRSAEEGDPRVGNHYTTDVEVSPLLTSISNGTAVKSGSATPKPSAAPTPVFVPQKKTRSEQKPITVYRGLQPGATQ